MKKFIERIVKKIVRNELAEQKYQITAHQEEVIHNECITIAKELFAGEEISKVHGGYYSKIRRTSIIAIMKHEITQEALGQFRLEYKERALDFIRGEEFIDLVVKRIKDKQIGD